MEHLPHMLHGAGIFTYIWAIFGLNVGKYSSTMEHMGTVLGESIGKIFHFWGRTSKNAQLITLFETPILVLVQWMVNSG
jgi:hypothetical protein